MSLEGKYAAEGKVYAAVGRKREEEGNLAEARSLYLKAAASFLEASKSYVATEDKEFATHTAEMFYGKAISLTHRRKNLLPDVEEGLAEIVPIEKPNVNFSDVGGLESVKEEIRKAIVHPFLHPELYEQYGKKAGGSILLYGPPGCGKTFIAKAAAGECKASFIAVKIGEILNKYLGESEKNVIAVFNAARKHQPAILFFDEYDALGGRRDEMQDARGSVVNALLTELDGVTSTPEKRLTLAATNKPWAVDPALRRPPRFTKLLFLPPPDFESRVKIFQIYMRERPVASDVDYKELAGLTDNYSSVDIAQICEDAADIPLTEALNGKPPREITRADFHEALKRRKPSIIPWLRMAKDEINKTKEQDVFPELVEFIDKHG